MSSGHHHRYPRCLFFRLRCGGVIFQSVALLVETKDTSDPAASTSFPRDHILLRWRRNLKAGDLIDARCAIVLGNNYFGVFFLFRGQFCGFDFSPPNLVRSSEQINFVFSFFISRAMRNDLVLSSLLSGKVKTPMCPCPFVLQNI